MSYDILGKTVTFAVVLEAGTGLVLIVGLGVFASLRGDRIDWRRALLVFDDAPAGVVEPIPGDDLVRLLVEVVGSRKVQRGLRGLHVLHRTVEDLLELRFEEADFVEHWTGPV